MINFIKRNIKKSLFGLCFLCGLTMLSGKSFAIDLNFTDKMLSCFPCAYYAHYDARFNVQGNDFDGVVIWSGVQELSTGYELSFTGLQRTCRLDQCADDTIICHKQVLGLYYNKQRGERMRALDPITHATLSAGTCSAQGYDQVVFTGGWYTDCIGQDTAFPINPYGIYGEIRHTWSGETYHLYAGLDYDFDANAIVSDRYYFVNNLQFIPQTEGNYDYYTGGLQGILFDTYGGIASVGSLMDCVMQGDGAIVKHGETITGYRHNNVLGVEPVFDSAQLQCYNGQFLGRTGYTYSTPLSCHTVDGVIIPHSMTGRMREQRAYSYEDRGYVYNPEYFTLMRGWTGAQIQFCWDGYLSGDTQYMYAHPTVLPPKDCLFSGTDKLLRHGESYTGYKYGITTYEKEEQCQYGAVYGCDNGTIFVKQNTWIPGPWDLSLTYGTPEWTGQESLYNDAQEFVGDDLDNHIYYTYDQCIVADPQSCLTPDGQVLSDGESRILYQKNKVIQGEGICSSQERICHNGVLSGSYQYEICEVTPLDLTPDPRVCAPTENVDLSTMVTTPSYQITGMTTIYTGLASITSTSGTLLINGIEMGSSAVVHNGDVIALKVQSANQFATTTYVGVDIEGMQTLCPVMTKRNSTTTFSDPFDPPVLTRSQQKAIWKDYMNFLDHYADEASDICFVTNSLYTILSRELFTTNKNLIVISDNDLKRRLYYKKLILEFLLKTTAKYRQKVVHTKETNSDGVPVEYEVVGCSL